MSAIGITLRRAEEGGDPGASKLFGVPSSLPDGGKSCCSSIPWRRTRGPLTRPMGTRISFSAQNRVISTASACSSTARGGEKQAMRP